jgi:predicted HicB family RNase H-like nuclease
MEVKQPIVTLRCTPELHRALKQLAHIQQISMNVLICDVLTAECKKAGLIPSDETKS